MPGSAEHHGHDHAQHEPVLRKQQSASSTYFCPMCEGIESDKPGYCPKCITLRTREALICPACGLVFANFRAEEHQPSAALESAWRGLEDRWSRQEEHEKFLQMAFNMDELAKAGRLYRIRLATTADDVQAKAALESMVRMASTAAAAASKTDPAEFQRHRRKVLAVSAMLFFVIPIAALLVNFLLRTH